MTTSLYLVSQQVLFLLSVNFSMASLEFVTKSALTLSDLSIVLKTFKHIGSASQTRRVAMQLHREAREATESGLTLIDLVPAKPNSEIGRT